MNSKSILVLVLSIPVMASADTVRLTADESAKRLVEVSHVSMAATERTVAAASYAKATDAATLPSLTLSANVSERSSVPEFRLPTAIPGVQGPVLVPDITETYGAAVRAQQALYTGGAITAQRKAARHDEAASVAQRDLTNLDLRWFGRSAYWEVVRARTNLDAARAQEKRALRLVSDVKDTFEAGLSVRADVLAAEERSARARTLVVRSEAAAANALAQLRSLLAIPSGDEVQFADSLLAPLPPPPASVPAIQSEGLTLRPETRVLAAQREALRERENLAAAPGKPSVQALAQYDYSRPNTRYFPQADEWKGSWAIALGASFTVFDGGKWRADVSTSRALRRAAEQEFEELKRRVSIEVETSARDLASALEAVISTDAAHAAAVENEKAAEERREAGLAAIIEVLDAQSQLASAEQEKIQARSAAWLAAARLDRAAGR
jgi:outer membrane protein TolC